MKHENFLTHFIFNFSEKPCSFTRLKIPDYILQEKRQEHANMVVGWLRIDTRLEKLFVSEPE